MKGSVRVGNVKNPLERFLYVQINRSASHRDRIKSYKSSMINYQRAFKFYKQAGKPFNIKGVKL